MSPNDDFSPALPDVRPAPQAGCFVSGLLVSSESQIALRHRAFGTVVVVPSSGASEPPETSEGEDRVGEGVWPQLTPLACKHENMFTGFKPTMITLRLKWRPRY